MNEGLRATLLEKEQFRQTVLLRVYESTGGQTNCVVDLLALCEEAGRGSDVAHDVYRHHVGERNMKPMGTGFHVGLTHQGVKMAEDVIAAREPKKLSITLPAPIVNNTFHGPVGAVQTGSGNTANVSQRLGTAPREVVDALQQLRARVEAPASNEVAPERRQEAIELLEGVEAEAQSPTPARARVSAYAAALDVVLVSSAANALAQTLKLWPGT